MALWDFHQALLLLTIAASASADRPSASEYVATQCAAYAAAYDPLVDFYLSQFRGGFSTSDILRMPAMYNGTRLQKDFKGALPVLYVLDGEVYRDSSLPRPGGKRLKNLEFFGIPLLQQLGQLAGVMQFYTLAVPRKYLSRAPLARVQRKPCTRHPVHNPSSSRLPSVYGDL